MLFLSSGTVITTDGNSKSKRNVILDVDTSGDDLMAVLYFLGQTEIDVKAITIVHGVSNVDEGAEIVLRLLTLTGHTNIPVAKGAKVPLEGKNAFPVKWQPEVDRPFGLELPAHSQPVSSLTAAEMITDLIKTYRGNISIMALGPLTNIAEAFNKDPSLVEDVTCIFVSDGAVYVKGSISPEYPAINNSVSGWNLWVDARAANIVFGSGAKITLVPLDLTAMNSPNPILIRSGVVNKYKARIKGTLDSSLASLMSDWITYYHSDTNISNTEEQAPVWDLVAAEIFTNPDICTGWQHHFIQIKAGDPETAGQIIISTEKKPNVSICLTGSQALFDSAFLETAGIQHRLTPLK
jgi:purine nucleosidase